jgi:hypothetical protein
VKRHEQNGKKGPVIETSFVYLGINCEKLNFILTRSFKVIALFLFLTRMFINLGPSTQLSLVKFTYI